MSKMYRWGIVGAGGIAHKFADALNHVENAKLQAIASTNAHRAKNFAQQFSIPDSYDSYEQLFSCDTVDIVYVATPHNFHCNNTLDALKAKKHVLCEKPMAINRSQVKQMINAAQDNKVFLMEAMWTRFLPMMTEVRDMIEKGTIGQPQLLYADFGVKFDFDPKHRTYNPDLAGGALLDLGGYLKSKSAVRINRELERVTGTLFGRSYWSRGYCVSMVGLDEQAIRRYIQEQEKHEKEEMDN